MNLALFIGSIFTHCLYIQPSHNFGKVQQLFGEQWEGFKMNLYWLHNFTVAQYGSIFCGKLSIFTLYIFALSIVFTPEYLLFFNPLYCSFLRFLCLIKFSPPLVCSFHPLLSKWRSGQIVNFHFILYSKHQLFTVLSIIFFYWFFPLCVCLITFSPLVFCPFHPLPSK